MQLVKKISQFNLFTRRVWALAAPYFRSEDKWKARGLLAAIVALNLGAVYMLVLLLGALIGRERALLALHPTHQASR